MKIVLMSFLMLLGATAYGFGQPKHSKVEAVAKTGASGLAFDFKIVPNPKMVATFDAPWKFEVVKAEGLEFKSNKLKKTDMDEKLPGFSLAPTKTPTADKGELSYKLTSFICTEAKTNCYREVHKGTLNWSK